MSLGKKDKDGDTPADDARLRNHHELAALLDGWAEEAPRAAAALARGRQLQQERRREFDRLQQAMRAEQDRGRRRAMFDGWKRAAEAAWERDDRVWLAAGRLKEETQAMVAQAAQTSARMAMARDERGGGEEEAKGGADPAAVAEALVEHTAAVAAVLHLQAALPALQRPRPPDTAATAVAGVDQLHGQCSAAQRRLAVAQAALRQAGGRQEEANEQEIKQEQPAVDVSALVQERDAARAALVAAVEQLGAALEKPAVVAARRALTEVVQALREAEQELAAAATAAAGEQAAPAVTVVQAAERAAAALAEVEQWRGRCRNALTALADECEAAAERLAAALRDVADKVAASRSRDPPPLLAPLRCYEEAEAAARTELRGFDAAAFAKAYPAAAVAQSVRQALAAVRSALAGLEAQLQSLEDGAATQPRLSPVAERVAGAAEEKRRLVAELDARAKATREAEKASTRALRDVEDADNEEELAEAAQAAAAAKEALHREMATFNQLASQAATAARTGPHPELLCEARRFCEEKAGKKLALRTAWQPAVLQLALSDGLDQAGMELGQFGELQPIGKGQHACFRGTHPADGRQVVLKRYSFTHDARREYRRMVMEARVLRHVKHPCVADAVGTFLQHTKAGDFGYLVMPDYTGGDLAAFLREHGRPRPDVARRIAHQVVHTEPTCCWRTWRRGRWWRPTLT